MTIKASLLKFFTSTFRGPHKTEHVTTELEQQAPDEGDEDDDLSLETSVSDAPVPASLSPEQEKLRILIMHARAIGAAVAQTKVVRYLDKDGAIVWLSGLSPQDAHDKVETLDTLGFVVLDIVDIAALPRKPSWEIEYEDPQCYSIDAAPREDPANYNLGTVELRMELIAAGSSPRAVVRATSACFTSPTFWVH